MTLGEAYPLEQARCRELLAEYKALGPVGIFGAVMIEEVLRRADQAAIRQDLSAMISLYKEMKECK
jgi:hypothetical protein